MFKFLRQLFRKMTIEEIHLMAKHGELWAQFDLGHRYREGIGVQQDYEEAAKWYRTAVEQGSEPARTNLADMYAKGEAVPPDGTEATESTYSKRGFRQEDMKELRQYLWLALHGDAGAQCTVGYFFMVGKGVEVDYEEAEKWLRKAAEQRHPQALFFLQELRVLGQMGLESELVASKAEELVQIRRTAEQGDADAQTALGMMYAEGESIPQDVKEAWKWFSKAAEQGDTKALSFFEEMAQSRRSAEQGDAESQRGLGMMYAEGIGVEQDYDEALKWFRRSAEQGYDAAQNDLGVLYLKGIGVAQDYNEGLKWFRKSAEQGNSEGQFNLGLIYAHGRGVAQDGKEAVKWYLQAAEQGHPVAEYNLGQMYWRGDGVPQDHGEAVRWYRRSAEQGYAKAQKNLGILYVRGMGITQDYGQALKWLRKAAEQGNTDAQYALGAMYDEGEGVEQDFVNAYMWYDIAIAFGDGSAVYPIQKAEEDHDSSAEKLIAEAQKHTSDLVQEARKNRDSLVEEMTLAQVTKAQRLAREWLNQRCMITEDGIIQKPSD